MALANFFDRATQSLTQVLKGVDPTTLGQRLDAMSVAVAFDDQALTAQSTFVTLELATNLLARLYPKLAIVHSGTDSAGRDVLNKLGTLAASINPQLQLVNSSGEFDAALCVGAPDVKARRRVYVASDSWNLELRIDQPTGSLGGHTFNPLAAAAAACFGTGELFRYLLSDVLTPRHQTDGFVLSLLDYSTHASPTQELPFVNLNDLVLVGVGAIGNAAVWCLERVPDLRGSISIVDHETVDLSNLQRYVLTDQESIPKKKVDLAKQRLSRQGLDVHEFCMPFGDYVREHRQECRFDVIAVAVDNPQDRIAAQAVLPRLALNGWTGEGGYLGVSRHHFDGPQACLACMYLSTVPRRSRTEAIADATGLAPGKAVELVVNRAPLTRQLLTEISANKGYAPNDLLRWEGKTLDEFYSEAVCGGVLMHLGRQVNEPEVLVPLAHQSALAGVLLACEVVKAALNLTLKGFPAETRVNVLTDLPDYLSMPRGKTIDPKCICSDDDYLQVYRQKHQAAE